MPTLHVIKGLPEDLPTELGRRKTLHEDERRKVNQRNEQAGQVFERTHFEKGRFFEQEAERLLGKDLAGCDDPWEAGVTVVLSHTLAGWEVLSVGVPAGSEPAKGFVAVSCKVLAK